MLRYLIVSLVDVYSMLIFVYVIMSWLPTDRGILRDVNAVLAKVCDPYLNLFKKLIPPLGGMVDITPIIALLVLQIGCTIAGKILMIAKHCCSEHGPKGEGMKYGYHGG